MSNSKKINDLTLQTNAYKEQLEKLKNQFRPPLLPDSKTQEKIDKLEKTIKKNETEIKRLKKSNNVNGLLNPIQNNSNSPSVNQKPMIFTDDDNEEPSSNALTGAKNINQFDTTQDQIYPPHQTRNKTQSFTQNIVQPFDRRLQNVYSSTERVGNSVPMAPDMVGSPSIMNPYALMRFQAVAGPNQHRYLLDQEGQNEFRNATYTKPPYNAGNYDKATTQQIEIKDKNGKVIDKTTKITNANELGLIGIRDEKTGALEKGAVFADQAGDMYQWVEVPGLTVWTANAFNLKGIYNKIQLEPEMTENTPNPESERNKTSSTNPNNPNSHEFWFLRYGYTQADSISTTADLGSGLTPTKWYSAVVISAMKEDPPRKFSDEEVVRIKQENARVVEDVAKYAAMRWTGIAAREKSYLTNPDAEDEMAGIAMEPTYENLCNTDVWKADEQFVYEHTDFLFCKYYKLIPNNRLITLRRFPVPILDHGRIPDQSTSKEFVLPIARAVTWIDGEDNKWDEVMDFGWNFNWESVTADINDVQERSNASGGGEIDLFGGNSTIGKMLGFVQGRGFDGGSAANEEADFQREQSMMDPYGNGGTKANQVNGPVNVIHESLMRKRGLGNKSDSITLKFRYILNSIGGINPKAALQDIIANFLALTYNDAPFWGGANRYFPDRKIYPFLGAKKGKDAFMRGDLGGWVDAIGDQFTSALSNLGDVLQSLFTNPAQALSKLANQGFKMYAAKKSAAKRPGTLMFKALLDGSPVGEWHLVIGNPFNPVGMIGNLVVDNASMEFPSYVLGADDFPEEVLFTVTLKHGRPRDKGDFESILNRGSGKFHYAPYGQRSEPWNSASSTKNTPVKSGKTNLVTGTMEIGQGGTQESLNVPFRKPSPANKIYTPAHSKHAQTKFNLDEYEGWEKLFRSNTSKIGKAGKSFVLSLNQGFKTVGEDKIKKTT